MRRPKNTVVIVGGGASGTLVAAHLLRRSRDVLVIVIEPRAQVGRGMAYSTPCPGHLLNVPAAKMSAFPDEPAHFLQWLWRAGKDYGDTSFVPRMVYGDYLESVLGDARNGASDVRYQHIRQQATACARTRDGIEVRLANGQSTTGDALVLALGNAAPAPWPHLSQDVAASGRFFGNAWEPGALQPADQNEPVLLLGTGLTAVDALIALREHGHRGPVHMTSRRGLLPHGHRLFAYAPIPCTPAASARNLIRNLRAAAADAQILHGNWRFAVDGVRPQTNSLWQSLSAADQSRFLRHARAFWDVHRHRMAPQIAALVEQERACGSLTVSAGRTGLICLRRERLHVELRPRGSATARTIEAARIVNCTGPESRPERVPNPLIQDLLRQRLMLSHPLRMGFLADNEGALLDAHGVSSPSLFTLGPPRLGGLLETVAMPEIRQQASDLAGLLMGAPTPRAEEFLASFAYSI